MTQQSLANDNSHGTAVAISGGDNTTSDCVSGSESAILAEYMAGLLTEMKQLLSECHSSIDQFYDESDELPKLECRTDNGSIKNMKVILVKACELIKNEKQIKHLAVKSEFSTEGKDAVIRFVDRTDSSHLVICTDSPHRLMLVTQKGEVMRQIDISSPPYDLCVKWARIYVTMDDKNKVAVYNLHDFSIVKYFPANGGCWGIDTIKDKLVIVCHHDKCVRIMTDTGVVISTSKHPFKSPSFVTVSERHGAIYVSDCQDNSVVVLSHDFLTLRVITHVDMNDPFGLCMARSMLYVTSSREHKLLQIDVDGKEIRTLISDGSVKRPKSVCITAGERCIALGNYDKQIIIYEGQV